MYKNLLIVGSDKCGKTTLANLIAEKNNCNTINLDNIIEAFEQTFPKEDNDNYLDFQSKFIANYINQISDKKNFYNAKKVVLEGKLVNLDKIILDLDQSKISIIGLTYDNIDKVKFARDIKENAPNVDIYRFYSESIILGKISKFMEDNNKISSIFEQYDLNCYDVSYNRQETFDEIINSVNKLTTIGSTYKVKKKK